MGAFALLLLIPFFWFLRPHPAADGAKVEARDTHPSSSTQRRIQWARGSRPPEAQQADASPVIRGVVLGADGGAVAGATVVAKDYQVAGNLPTTVSSTQSDEQGRFELSLKDGAYYVHAAKDGYGPSHVPARSGETVSLILYKSGVVEGHVRDERGAPVTHFAIDLITPMNDGRPALAPHWSKVFDSPDGYFRVTEMPFWNVKIRASAAGYAPSFCEKIRAAPGEVRSADFTMSPGCEVDGVVEDRSGKPLGDVFLDAEAHQAAGMNSDGAADATSQAKSDTTGHFHLTNVPKGRVVVRAYDGESAVTAAHVEISDCASVQPIKIMMSDGGSVVGVVRAADGTPVSGASLTATHRAIGFVSATTDAEGRYRFDRMPVSLVIIVIQHEGIRAEQQVKVKEGEVVERDITLPTKGAAVVEGRVTAGGTAVAGAQVELMGVAGRVVAAFHATTTKDGSYRFTDVPKGGYQVQVVTSGSIDHAVIKGDETVKVDLDLGKPLTIKW